MYGRDVFRNVSVLPLYSVACFLLGRFAATLRKKNIREEGGGWFVWFVFLYIFDWPFFFRFLDEI